MTIIERADLACREGSKDAVYHIQVVQREGGYTVDYQNGRRGGTLTNLTKTKAPIALDAAMKIFNKVVKEKTTASPPYQPIAGSKSTQAMTQISAEMAGRATGLIPQLLNEIDPSDEALYIQDSNFIGEQKFNGERRSVRSFALGTNPIGANRKGLEVPLEPGIAMSMNGICCAVDGEIIGDRLYVFDLVELDGLDIRNQPLKQRKIQLNRLTPHFGGNITVVKSATTSTEKRELLARIKELKQEGIVFKKLDMPYEAGRPASGGSQVKLKDYRDATVIMVRCNDDRRSMQMGVYDSTNPGAGLILIGNVTIPPNQPIPAENTLHDVRYLYAYPNGGSLFQPTYLKPRSDLDMSDADYSRLKFKVDDVEVLIDTWLPQEAHVEVLLDSWERKSENVERPRA